MSVISGKLVRTSTVGGGGAIPVPSGGLVVKYVTDLRALIGSSAVSGAILLQYSASGPLGGGEFVWDASPGVDDGVLRFNQGGLTSNTAGWQRVYSGPIHTHWAGVISNGSANDTVAFQRAIDVAIAKNEPLVHDGSTIIDTLTISSPLKLTLGKGVIGSSGAALVMFQVSANFVLEGMTGNETRIQPMSGGTAIKLTADWSTGIDYAGQRILVKNIEFKGGAYAFDPSGAAAFSGLARFENCAFFFCSQKAINVAGAAYWLQLETCWFFYNEMAYESTLNVEVMANRCVFIMSDTGSCSVKLQGTYHEHFVRCQFFGSPSASINPDIIIDPSLSATGYEYLDKCEFGSEHEFNLDKRRRRILIKNGSNPGYYLTRLRLNGCEFLRVGNLALTAIGRNTGVATATVTHMVAAGHGLQVGDKIHVLDVTVDGGSFNGEHTVTNVPTIDTVSWASAGSNVGQASIIAGSIASGETVAIGLENPVADLNIEGCLFEQYAYAVDDTPAIQSQDSRGRNGGGRWVGNRLHGPASGLACRELKSNRPGRWFSTFESDDTSPLLSYSRGKYVGETIELRQRLKWSEALTNWTATGVTVTGGQTDPFGGSTAVKVVRNGTNPIVYASSAGGPWTVQEAITMDLDLTSLSDHPFLQIWAKADVPVGDPTRTLWLMLIDAAGKTHWHASVTLPEDGSWKPYKFALGYDPSYTTSLTLVVSAGCVDLEPRTVYLWHPHIDDYGGDYLPTRGASYASLTAGHRSELPAYFANSIVFDETVGGLVKLQQRSTDAAPLDHKWKGGAAKTGASTHKDGGDAIVEGGAPAAGGIGGSAKLNDGDGNTVVWVQNNKLSFYGHALATQQAVTGTLSAVTDANAKTVLTSIIAALVASGLVTNGTG
ncbi:MAG: hypothetical protein KGL39_18035 [Patescibacteria group bacterium]|nr:hypothetical protein [Patescibacteria group bacterium]